MECCVVLQLWGSRGSLEILRQIIDTFWLNLSVCWEWDLLASVETGTLGAYRTCTGWWQCCIRFSAAGWFPYVCFSILISRFSSFLLSRLAIQYECFQRYNSQQKL